MYRPLASRSARPAVYLGHANVTRARNGRSVASRKLTTPPPSSQAQPGTGKTSPAQPEGSNTLIILSALGALGGLYYYYTRGQPALDRESARRKEEETERKVREVGDAAKNKLESVTKREYDEAKGTIQGAATTARARATEARTDLTDRARQGAHEAHVKLDDIRSDTERKIGDIRERSQKQIDERKGDVVREAREAEDKTRGWFGWGTK